MADLRLHEIKDLEKLIKPKLNGKVLGHTVTRLTAPGDNFGSIMIKIDIKVQRNQNEEDELHLVGKMLPDAYAQELFNSQLTFKNEIAWYSIVIPTMQEFQREQHVDKIMDNFAETFGARISLDPASEVVDNDAVLLLENLLVQGYQMKDRLVGFDLKLTKVILKTLANLHATAIALKLTEPKLFQSNITPYFFKPFPRPQTNDEALIFEDDIKVVGESANCQRYIEQLKNNLAQGQFPRPQIREPWCTTTHGDFWTNNIMVKTTQDDIKVKIVDLQVTDYRSGAADLIFFLFTSVNLNVLKTHIDQLIQYYYDEFINSLIQLKTDTEPFSFCAFQKELELECKLGQVGHILFMLHVILAPKQKVPKEIELKGMIEQKKTFSIGHKERLWYVISELGKRGWIF